MTNKEYLNFRNKQEEAKAKIKKFLETSNKTKNFYICNINEYNYLRFSKDFLNLNYIINIYKNDLNLFLFLEVSEAQAEATTKEIIKNLNIIL